MTALVYEPACDSSQSKTVDKPQQTDQKSDYQINPSLKSDTLEENQRSQSELDKLIPKDQRIYSQVDDGSFFEELYDVS